jgi:hypothetical protein
MTKTRTSGISRRELLAMTGISLGASLLATDVILAISTPATPVQVPEGKTFTNFKQIEAGVLNTSYAELGPSNGRPVILLHGWPYDIHSYIEVAPLLASNGYRVLVPYLRGYGTTRFLSSNAFRNGQPSALAKDVVDFMDALKIDKAV